MTVKRFDHTVNTFGTTGDRQQNRWLPAAINPLTQTDHVANLAGRTFSTITVGLVDHEQITDFENARLRRLDSVTHTRRKQHDHRIRNRDHLDLTLSDAHGFDEYDIATGSIEHTQCLRCRPRKTTEMPS